VRVGRSPGVYVSNARAQEQVRGVPGNEYRRFDLREAAERWIAEGGGGVRRAGYGERGEGQRQLPPPRRHWGRWRAPRRAGENKKQVSERRC
jgi:hypothetical protein